MRVAFDMTAALMDRGGSGVHTRQLASALALELGADFQTVNFGAARPVSASRSWGDRVRTVQRDVWWANAGCVAAARRAGADLLHLPVPIGPVSGSFPLVVTVHDLFVLSSPERFRAWMRYYLKATMPRLLRRADAVIASSHATRDEILTRIGLPPERVHVIGLGADPRFAAVIPPQHTRAVRERLQLPERFILTVGQLEPRKNIARLVRAVLAARRTADAADMILVHVGPGGWLEQDVTEAMQLPGASEAVRFAGFVPADDLPAVYQLARGFAFPSLGEGFGIPLLEAMASGTPILTSRVTSLPEVAGGAALLVDPTDVSAIADGMARLWTDDALVVQLRALGAERVKSFRWDSVAAATARVYRGVAG